MVDFGTDDERSFADRLERTTVTCTECGFSDTVLEGAWRTRGERSRENHLAYALECPDCASTREIPLTF